MKIFIDNFLGGISDSDRIGTQGSYYVGFGVNPINPYHYGYLTAGGITTTLTNTSSQINSMTIAPAPSNVIDVYAIEGDGNRIHKIKDAATVPDWVNGTEYPFTISNTTHIGHTTVIGEDIKTYSLGTTNYILYSWNDNADGDIGIVNIEGAATFDSKFVSREMSGGQVLQKAFPHPMIEWGESGMLYVADGRNIHQIDGQGGGRGVFTPQKLQLPYGWVANSFFDAGDFLGITAQRYLKAGWGEDLGRGKSAVFFWDGSSPIFNKRIFLEEPTIVASISVNGNYYVFCIDATRDGIIKGWDGNGFKTLKRIIGNVATTGSSTLRRFPSNYGGVDVFGDKILITQAGSGTIGNGEVFLYDPNTNSLYSPIISTSPTQTRIRSVLSVGLTGVLLSSNSNITGETSICYSSLSGTDNPNFLYKSLYYEFPQRAIVKYIKVYFKTLTAGQGVDVIADMDYGKKITQAGNISYAEDGAITTKRLALNEDCNSIRVVVQKDEGSGVKIGKIVIDYDFADSDIK